MMSKTQKLMVSYRSAKISALVFFCIGTLLFLLQYFFGRAFGLLFIGFAFVVFAAVYNCILFLLLLIDLIRRDRVESFFGLCLILANLPIAWVYLYILTEYPFHQTFY